MFAEITTEPDSRPSELRELIAHLATATGRPAEQLANGWRFELPDEVPGHVDTGLYFAFSDTPELDFCLGFQGRTAVIEPGRGEPRDTISGPFAAFLDFIENRKSAQALLLNRDWRVEGGGCGPADLDDVREHIRALEILLPASYQVTPELRRRIRAGAARTGRNFEIAVRPGLTPPDFNECHISRGIPVVMPAAVADSRLWSFDWLSHVFAATYTHLSRYPDCSYSVEECLARARTGGHAAFKAAIPLTDRIRERYSINGYFPAGACFDKAQSLLIAPADGSMPSTYRATVWHRDWADNLLAQMIGLKKVRIASPLDEDLFGLCATAACHYNVAVDYSRLDTRISLDPLGIRVREVVLQPGDLLYIPCGWLHTVENLTPTAAINCWRVRPPEMISSIV